MVIFIANIINYIKYFSNFKMNNNTYVHYVILYVRSIGIRIFFLFVLTFDNKLMDSSVIAM